MSRRRIFISHSTKDEATPAEAAARELQEALVRALDESGEYGVLLDRITLRPGDAWRARINLWVGGCDAAVVLVSRAALASAYVAYETSILSFRKHQDERFVLIPVLVPPVTLAELNASTLGTVQRLGEAQFVSGTQAEIIDGVLKALEASVHVESPVEKRAWRLVALMEGIHDRWIRDAAGLLGMEHVEAWLPGDGDRLRLRLAVQLMSVGMEAAIDAALLLRSYLVGDERTRSQRMSAMISIIASSWVDDRSARQVQVVGSQTPARALSLNAQRNKTARMYVVRALKPGHFYLANCNGIFGEEVAGALVKEIRASLARELKIKKKQKKKLLKNLLTLPPRQPILVTLDSRGITAEILGVLQQEFPNVVFFLLSGDGWESSLTPGEVEFLFPELHQGDEDAFIEQYDSFRLQLKVR
ncbi:MAG TPA: toll/interleukin-1 receptor domain-containing protein [Longimicrobium sp.]|nr:toll/interleukin-1 receptor domain-containing protein [Longimicrobium sp.]